MRKVNIIAAALKLKQKGNKEQGPRGYSIGAYGEIQLKKKHFKSMMN